MDKVYCRNCDFGHNTSFCFKEIVINKYTGKKIYVEKENNELGNCEYYEDKKRWYLLWIR